MPRKGHVQKREILPDPMYNSKLVTSLIDHLMIDGKRGTATKILYAALIKLRKKLVTTSWSIPRSNGQRYAGSEVRHGVLVVLTTKFQSKFVQNGGLL